MILYKFGRRIYGPHGNEMKYNFKFEVRHIISILFSLNLDDEHYLLQISIAIYTRRYSLGALYHATSLSFLLNYHVLILSCR
jgi:hypothetical protein